MGLLGCRSDVQLLLMITGQVWNIIIREGLEGGEGRDDVEEPCSPAALCKNRSASSHDLRGMMGKGH